ncbi:DUF4189 domain-containing protein [Nocardia sp. NPDC050406]|uniref:DUF4189 domain-containing protein n=1 Tax=Nocardia sp. NPDC050406 TaxID=3364318 RepID=UPI0037AC40EB
MSLLWKAFAVGITSAALMSVAVPSAGAERGPDGQLYGAIATGELVTDPSIPGGKRMNWGVAWNQPDQASAEQQAIQDCSYGCRVMVTWTDGCASVAESAVHLHQKTGVGATAEEAEQNAWANLDEHMARIPPQYNKGPHHILVTQCNG